MSSQVYTSLRQGLNPRQAETVEKLLRAGMEELRAVGHEALTIRTVAQRAGVAPATAYTYLASKSHLFAELFFRHLSGMGDTDAGSGTPTERVQRATRALVERIVVEPELATAVTPALLGSDPDVGRLRLAIGGELVSRFEHALGDADQPADPALLEAIILTFSGALLQAGMGLITYEGLAARLDPIVATIMRGNE